MKRKTGHIFLFLVSLAFYSAFQTEPAFAKNHREAQAKILALNGQIIAANEARDLPAALKAAEEAVRVAKAEYGEKSVEAANTMNNLASLYMHIKRVPEAEQLYKQSVLIELKELDPEGTEVATSCVNLGVAYAMQQKYTAAIDILNRALTIRLRKLGPDSPETKNAERMIADLKKLAYPNAEVI